MPLTQSYHRTTAGDVPDRAHGLGPPVAQRAQERGCSREEAASPELAFGFLASEHRAALQNIPTGDLLAEVEAAQWLALDLADVPGDSRAVAELQLEALVFELERRKRLLESRSTDPLRPSWPRPEDTVKSRVAAVKVRWPVEKFCREALGCDLEPAGRGRWRSRCPLPGHRDDTASFTIYTASDSAWCFGCARGGDVLKLAQFALGLERFTEALRALEQGELR